jgi:hypothetical protein
LAWLGLVSENNRLYVLPFLCKELLHVFVKCSNKIVAWY